MNLWQAIILCRGGQNRNFRDTFWLKNHWSAGKPRFLLSKPRCGLITSFNSAITRGLTRAALGCVVLLCQNWCVEADSSPIRVSFLHSDGILADTIDRLSSAGCSSEALAVFRSFALAECKSRELLSVRSSTDEAGYYSFDGLDDLLSAGPPAYPSLVRSITRIRKHSLTCFDVAALILRDGPVSMAGDRKIPRSENLAVLSSIESDGMARFQVRSATSRDYLGGVGLLSSIDSYQRATGWRERSMGEENLALILRAPHLISGHYANAEAPLRRLMSLRMEQWERSGAVFSPGIQVVLSHYVDFKGRFIAADHIALAVPLDTGWMLIEKNGTMNPLVRIEFPTVDMLADYAMSCFDSDVYDPGSPLHEAAYIVTANDQILRIRTRRHFQEIIRK